MDEVNREIGKRLRLVRNIFNEGGKLSAQQFAFLLNETRDKIISYELGRSSIPVRMLIELYNRGINIIWLLTGDGDIFAKNEAGHRFKNNIKFDVNIKSEIEKLMKIDDADRDFPILKVAAGKIAKSQKKDDKNNK
jgi:transcriptional regulator with XRE-family HTH domain